MNKTAATRATVNLRRAYFECRYGQLHIRTAFPSTGGFDENTPLLLLHPSPRSSRMLVPLLAAMGRDRSAYAIDTPGFGESDPPRARPAITDYAAAIGDFLDNLRLRRVDLLGVHAGAAIATELAIQRPQTVRRIVMVGIPVHTAAERAAFSAAPHPLAAAADGSHALGEWQRARAAQGPGLSLAQVSAACADALRSGPDGWWGPAASFAWAGHERLALVTQPTLVLRPRDELWEPTLRAQRLLRGVDWQDLPDAGHGFVEVQPDAVATRVRAFLDR
jgi:pimeloyl-ACP methyl ester carboxylesterase